MTMVLQHRGGEVPAVVAEAAGLLELHTRAQGATGQHENIVVAR
ncbi:hypothetical protein ACIA5G_52440 [Amycolatopsis sp. NPDC051758]